MKSSESKKYQTPTPTTEHASVVLGVWQYGKAKGFAENGQEDEETHQWRDVARGRRLGGRPADFRPFEVAWQYLLADRRPHFADGRLGVVQPCQSDGSFCRGPSLVERCTWKCGRDDLSGIAQGPRTLDYAMAAVVVEPSAPAYGSR